MCRFRWYHLALMLLLVPRTSSALDLRWVGGATDLTFTEAVRCTLVIQAGVSEGRLPSEWRLLWVADSASLQFVAADTLEACLLDEARMYRIQEPATAADSAAHRRTAYFCSEDGNPAVEAQQIVDLPAGGRGKFKVVALDPSDPEAVRVLASNQATYNGGVAGDFPSVALAASSSHDATQFVVRAAGRGLSEVVRATAQAPDALWSLPLQITEQSDSTLTAVAEVVASMPASVLRLSSTSGALSEAPLPADGQREGVDPDFEALADSCKFNHCLFIDPDPNVQVRDFAFFYAVGSNPLRGLFHLFYIRNHKGMVASSTTRSFGHAWSSDLRNWDSDTSATVFSVSANEWDRAHVWAPSIVQVGPNYQMFYTGVDDQDNPAQGVDYGNQRIGYATTSAIETGSATAWTRRDSPAYTVNWTGWADRDSATTGTHRHQFRDPFIMADPDNQGRYLLFAVGQKGDGDYAVGVARNEPGTLDVWQDLGYYRSTEYDYSANGHAVESVTALPDPAYPSSKTSAQATWRLLFTHGIDSPADSSIRFSAKTFGFELADTTLGPVDDRVWSTPATNLFTYLNGDSTAWGTYATEYLRVGQVDFLATYDGDVGIRVSRMLWNDTDFTLEQPSVTAVGGGWSEPEPRMASALGSGHLAFEIDMPIRGRARLGIYDVAGRRVRTLIEEEVPAGIVRVQWDGKDQAGQAARTGMYFARLSSEFGNRVVRAALVR